MKTFLYFQPEYVSRFQCDGSKCNARCCKGWTIHIDEATYKRYSRIKPKDKAKEITSRMKFDSVNGKYVIQLKEAGDEVKGNMRPCPFLTVNSLCSIQLEYGEDYLSQVCTTYPRITRQLGNFFERSLTLTCPVAAELILFNPEPMKFELIEVPDKVHSKHGRINITKLLLSEAEYVMIREVQITMITILQQRHLTLDQRLILLGLFLDKLQEYQTEEQDINDVAQLIAGYRSEEFLKGDAVGLAQSFTFDAYRFMSFMLRFINYTAEVLLVGGDGGKFFKAFDSTLKIKHDKSNQVTISEIATNFESLADARANFIDKHSSFLENYLINELFFGLYPWHFSKQSITKNYAIFLISYKIFELMTFATVHSGLDSKEELLRMVDWFMTRNDHNKQLSDRFLKLLEGIDDTYLLMATLL